MTNQTPPKPNLTKRLCKAIVAECINEGYADLWDESWNPSFQVAVKLTIAECRCAASVIDFHPTKAQILKAEAANDWNEYIAELDGVE